VTEAAREREQLSEAIRASGRLDPVAGGGGALLRSQAVGEKTPARRIRSCAVPMKPLAIAPLKGVLVSRCAPGSRTSTPSRSDSGRARERPHKGASGPRGSRPRRGRPKGARRTRPTRLGRREVRSRSRERPAGANGTTEVAACEANAVSEQDRLPAVRGWDSKGQPGGWRRRSPEQSSREPIRTRSVLMTT